MVELYPFEFYFSFSRLDEEHGLTSRQGKSLPRACSSIFAL